MSGTTGNAVSAYTFQGSNVRSVIGDGGEPWFVAKDVAEGLGYARFDSNLLGHVPSEWKGAKQIRTPGGHQRMAMLSEQGVYFFVARSDKPRAIPFQKWLAGEVLPSIRKTGRYEVPTQSTTPQIPQTFAEALRLAADLHEQVQSQAAQLERMQPAVEFARAVHNTADLMHIGDIGKALGHGRNRFFRMLRDAGILIKGSNLPYQRYLDDGWFQVIESTWKDSSDASHVSLTTMATGKGQIKLARKFPHPDDAARARINAARPLPTQ